MESDLTFDEKLERANDAEEMLNGRMSMLSETGKFIVNFMFKQLEVKLEQIHSQQFYITKYQRQLRELEIKLSKHVQAYFLAVFFIWLLLQLLKVDSNLNTHIFTIGIVLALPVTIHFLKMIGEISHTKNTIKQALDSKESMTSLLYVEFNEFNIGDLIKNNIKDISENEGLPLNKYWEEHMGRELIANIKYRIAGNTWLQS
jgi:hypothetical protein